MQYGNYVTTDKAHIQEAKDELLEGLIGTIRELAKQDKFWIVKVVEDADPLADEHVMVGWKIAVPQMSRSEPVPVIVDGEAIGLLGGDK